MFETPSDIITVIVAGSAILLVLVFFIISFLFAYQKKQLQHLKETQKLKAAYEKAITDSRLEIQDETLKYVGRELHDNLGQILSLVKLNLHDAHNPEQVTFAKELVAGAIRDVRTLSKSLNTDWADEVPLPHLIQTELDKVERSSNLQTEFVHEECDCTIDSKNKLIVFRTFQESLNNILKHANATLVTVNLHLAEDQNTCTLEIADNGVGFDITGAAQGSGLSNIKKRMEAIHGQADISSRLESGTRIELKFPRQPYAPGLLK
ncbi:MULTISPECIES: sensor histidine kinase [Rufibacter]|uniref:histidine kinase n=1 Tax=Rufibacter quisquiliarum TaxID=1549639 RepID=A0A839GFK4_9BACT|nr:MULTISPECIES: ATP-binding protein [Rufibacter]MBA9078424.1 signal transduction histidine kinase [Rufibacter quisquiliarum]